jgi:TonB family protein
MAADSARVFPVAKDPQLPSADQLQRRILPEIGDVATADIRLCVGPEGRVRNVELVRGTSLPEFNDAVLRDVADWQFLGMPGSTQPASLQSCEIARITYRPHP